MEQARSEFSDRIDVQILDIRQEINEILADKYEMRTMPLFVLGVCRTYASRLDFCPFPCFCVVKMLTQLKLSPLLPP